MSSVQPRSTLGSPKATRKLQMMQHIEDMWAPDVQQCRDQYNSAIASALTLIRTADQEREKAVADLTQELRETFPTMIDDLLGSSFGDLVPQQRVDSAALARVLHVDENLHQAAVPRVPSPPVSTTHDDDRASSVGSASMDIDAIADSLVQGLDSVANEDEPVSPASPPAPTQPSPLAEVGPSNRQTVQKIILNLKRLPNCAPSDDTRPTKKWCPGSQATGRNNNTDDPEIIPSEDDDVEATEPGRLYLPHSNDFIEAAGHPPRPRVVPDRGYLLSKQIEGRDLAFTYYPFGPGYFVLRCHQSTPGTWRRNPMLNASNHWASNSCPTHDGKRVWTKDEIMKQFAFRVEGIDQEWVERSNALRLRNLDRLEAQGFIRNKKRKGGARIYGQSFSVRGCADDHGADNSASGGEVLVAEPCGNHQGGQKSGTTSAGNASTPAAPPLSAVVELQRALADANDVSRRE